ncbi:mitochondrial GTP/GDP carrier protein 1 [Puccinia triticina 1-1 BBBD Race 1]|uniref:Mitochondrial GTP/GDP carrier protein 1 n=1 Tax=Puccinia triticina (isolate 1-1 / race 1 (BBBD)) TaxID=630390 RepID=A0A180GZJ1_PUCT1|nr:mitochondrial GTP/GDP carrier protein 1 [Puccinia triticina 1-1 BBBD Race 1]
MSPPLSSTQHRDSGAARFLGSGTSGVAELMIFHPVDTLAKRLMSNKSSSLNFNQIVFKNYAEAPIGKKFLSLFPGLGYAAGYKILQRIYKFGGQPYFKDDLNKHHKSKFVSMFGEKNGKAMTEAAAGSLTGIGEIVLLPLDVLKIKRQTNPEAFRSRSFLKIVADEGFSLYRGWGWTAARNAPGSFALFGGSAFTKEYLFKLEDYSKATWSQNFVCSIAGSISSIAISQPLDVIKTRIQNQNFESKQGGIMVIKDIMKHEGFGAFFKGLTPKVLVVGPKLIFSFTLAQSLIPMFGKYV